MHTFTSFAVSGFGSVAMLLWGISALLPIVLHLWNRRRHQTTTWAAMEFLLAAIRKNARRMRMEQLLLLLVRVAILLLLAVALADPILSQQPGLATIAVGRPAVHVVLVLDGSYSMGYTTEGETAYERARQFARQLVERSHQGDAFTLLHLTDPPRAIIARPAFDKADVINELQQADMLHGGADLAGTLDEALRVVTSAQRDFPRLQETRVFLLSDLGENTWQSVRQADVRDKLESLARLASVVVLDFGHDSQDNLAITNWRIRGAAPTAHRSVAFEATVRNFGAQDHRGQTVEFSIDDQVMAERTVDVPAGEEVTLVFQHRFDTPRQYRVAAKLGRDRLAEDNTRGLVATVHEAVDVLCVEGKQDAATYVSLALNPTPSAAGSVRTRVIPDGALLETAWEPYESIFLCNVTSVTEDEAAVLRDFVMSGGGLVLWLGDRVHPENYDVLLGESAAEGRLLPARPVSVAEGDFRLDPRDYEHPVVSPFRGFERAGLISVPVWKYWKLEPYADNEARQGLWIGEDPVLLDEPHGSGHVAMVALPGAANWSQAAGADSAWSAISVSPSFPPLVQELLAMVTAGRDAAHNVLVGQPISAGLFGLSEAAIGSQARVIVQSPSGQTDRVPWITEQGRTTWQFEDTLHQGFYAAQVEDSVDTTQWFAVNVDTAESPLRRIAADDLPDVVRRESDLTSDAPTRLASAGDDRPLFRWFLGAALALLLVESAVSHRQDQGAA